MFANRFTALIDACTLADVLRRNLLLTLAEAEFFRLRWSQDILDETEAAIAKIRQGKGHHDAASRAAKARQQMEKAFPDALVADFGRHLPSCRDLPDPKDAHVLAAALKTRAAVIVTENIRDFPGRVLGPLSIEVKSGDAFIADAIALGEVQAVEAIGIMRRRFKRPETSAEALLLAMEARGLTETVNMLKPYAPFL